MPISCGLSTASRCFFNRSLPAEPGIRYLWFLVLLVTIFSGAFIRNFASRLRYLFSRRLGSHLIRETTPPFINASPSPPPMTFSYPPPPPHLVLGSWTLSPFSLRGSYTSHLILVPQDLAITFFFVGASPAKINFSFPEVFSGYACCLFCLTARLHYPSPFANCTFFGGLFRFLFSLSPSKGFPILLVFPPSSGE